MPAPAKKDVEERVSAICEPLLAAEGLELIDVEYVRESGRWLLRLFIDKPGGVGLEECAAGSRAVDKVLEVEEIIPNAYSIEVSSPGLDRPLKKPLHFEQARGKVVRIKTFAAVGTPPRKSFQGTLTRVVEGAVTIDVAGAGTFDIDLAQIAKANLVFEWEQHGPGVRGAKMKETR